MKIIVEAPDRNTDTEIVGWVGRHPKASVFDKLGMR